jgi:glutamate racemase
MIPKERGKIGFFDSGYAGLGTMRAVQQQLPQYSYVYLGDTAHLPFASKPAADIRIYTQKGVSYLFDQGCEIVIITCNTAAAQSLRFLQRQFLPKFAPHRHVLGTIVPAVERAVMATQNNKIGVLATKGVVDAMAFPAEIQKLRPGAAIYQQAAPELVPLIESGLHHTKEMSMVLRHYLQPLTTAGIDTLILGCTHYEVIADEIAEIMGSNVVLMQEPPAVAERLQDYLFRHADLSHQLALGSSQRIMFTAHAEVYSGLSREFYGSPVMAEQVTLK